MTVGQSAREDAGTVRRNTAWPRGSGSAGFPSQAWDGARRLTLHTTHCLANPFRGRGLRRLVALGTPGNGLAAAKFGRRGPGDRRARRLYVDGWSTVQPFG
jgi:hypothetical protein